MLAKIEQGMFMRGRILAGAALIGGLALQGGGALADQHAAPTIDPSQACHPPSYPSQARRLEQQGTVVLRFLIDPNGVAQKSEIVSSSGYPELDKAAQDALFLCHFKPAQIDGRLDPDPAWALLRYTWKLSGPALPNGAPAAPLPAVAATPFVLKCAAHPEADFADQIAAVEPPAVRVGGSARLTLPPVAGTPQGQCAGRYYRALADSLRRSRLFDRLDVVENGIEDVRPRSQGEDFTLWIQAEALAVAYRGGARSPVANDGQGLAAWVRSLPSHLQQVQIRQGNGGYSLSASLIAGQPYLAYRGREYLTTVDLVREVRRETAEELRTLPAAHGAALGRRLHVQLASEAEVIARAEAANAKAAGFLKPSATPANTTLLAISQLSLAMIGYTTSQAQAQALRGSGFYQTVDLEEGDAPDPALGDYDAVMWNDPSAPMKWRVKDSFGVVHELSATIPALQPWLDAVRSAAALGAR